MNLTQEFNSLNGRVISRPVLERILLQAKEDKHILISKRIERVLNNYSEKSFLIQLKEEVENVGLNGAEQNVLLPMLPYLSEDDSLGLNKPVSSDDIYSYITDLIINTIDKVGHLPWQKEWIGSGSNGAAKNYVSKKEYTGANFLLNFDIKFDKEGNPYLVPINFIQPYYLTFNQIKEAKATLKEGSKARRVIYYTIIFNYDSENLKIKTTDREKFNEFVRINGLTKEDLKENLFKIPVIKYYNVYRADHCEGLKFEEPKANKKVNPIKEAQAIIDGYKNPPTYTFVGDKAYYQPAIDKLNMPKIEAFTNEAFYYCTFFHEAVHSTGAEKRLHRDFSGRNGDKSYAYEELIAELGAVFLCGEAGILFHTKENSAKYLKYWNTVLVNELQNDNRFFLKASAQAQKAVNHILGREVQNEENKEAEKKAELKKTVRKTNPKQVKPIKKPVTKKVKTPGETKAKTPVKSTILETEKLKSIKKSSKSGLKGVIKNENEKPIATNKNISDLEKLGFVSASKVPEQPKDVFCLNGDIGAFLQKIQPHKALILIKGTKHTSKSQLAMQIANGFAEIGKPVAYIDYEQGGMESKDTIDSINRNTSEAGRKLIAIKGFLEKPLEELKEFCKYCQVIVADSVTDLGITADQLGELRVNYPKVIWVFISQVKENGEMYGGNKMAHNPTAIIKCHPSENPKERFATLEKNRGNDLTLKYNMYYKKVYGNGNDTEPVTEPKTKQKRKLSFKVN